MHEEVWKLTLSISDIEQQNALENNGLAVYSEAITNKKIVEVVNKELFLNWFMERMTSVKNELSKVKSIKKFKINSSYDKNAYKIILTDPEIDMLGPKFELNAMQVKETETSVESEKSLSPKSDDDDDDEDYEYDYELHHFDKDDKIYHCRYEDCDKKYKKLERLKKHLDDKEHYAEESYDEDEEDEDEDEDEEENDDDEEDGEENDELNEDEDDCTSENSKSDKSSDKSSDK